MDTVLVTGGAGFIGSALCRRLLAEGLEVVAIDDFSGSTGSFVDDVLPHEHFVLANVNINNREVVEELFGRFKFDIIYHLAANTSIPKGQNNIDVDIQNTFLTTISILQMAVKYKVKKFVFTSSSTIYGESEVAFDENSNLHPISYYGAAKLSSEAFISAFSSRYNIQTWIVRFCNVVGPYFTRGVVSDIKKKINAGNKVIHMLGDGKQEKPFLYIDDAVDGLAYVVSQATELINTYLVGNCDTIPVQRIAEIALEEKQYDAQILFDNAPTWSGDVQKYEYDISKIRSLGWQPRFNSEEAIRKSFK